MKMLHESFPQLIQLFLPQVVVILAVKESYASRSY